MSEVKILDSKDHQDGVELEKIAKYNEVLDSVAFKLYGHWLANGMKKNDLDQSQQKSRRRSSREIRERKC